MKTQTCYRLTRGHNGVPDSAPRHLHWHSLDNALRDIAAWAEERLSSGKLFGGVANVNDDDRMWHERRRYEIRPLTWEITTKLREVDPDDDYAQCATVIVKVYVERRFYKTVRKPLTAVVDGVKLEGYGPEERVYTSDWTTDWLPPDAWGRARDGDRAYLTAWIPVSQHTLEWGDEPAASPDLLLAAEQLLHHLDVYEDMVTPFHGTDGERVYAAKIGLYTAIARARGKES